MFGPNRRRAMKVVFLAMVIFGEAALLPLLANMPLTDEIAACDKAADDAVAAIRTPQELAAKIDAAIKLIQANRITVFKILADIDNHISGLQ